MKPLLQRSVRISLVIIGVCVPSVRSAIFTSVPIDLPPLSGACAAWGDFDNDGRLDIFVAGNTGSNRISQIWRNTGAGFTLINAGLPGVEFGAVALGDYDNDGRLDLVLAGNTGSNRITQLWRNTGAGFVLVNV